MERTYKVTINFKPMVYYVKSNRQEDARKLAFNEYDSNDDMGNVCIKDIDTELLESSDEIKDSGRTLSSIDESEVIE